ncbi:MAG: hypothetical protein IPG34_19670 [Rhodocyclaceae bacterium]|nr:hypothetical protein [Rhodocyclaceae bacterium]
MDKMEFVHPHTLGDGLKLLEMGSGGPGIGTAMILLMADKAREYRGGGDPSHGAFVLGSWAGDRVMLVGDYATDDDGPPINGVQRSWLYSLCIPEGKLGEVLADLEGMESRQQLSGPRSEMLAYLRQGGAIFRDISMEIAAAIEQELGGKFIGEGWRDWSPGPEYDF